MRYPRLLCLMLLAVSLSACAPKLRFKPGEMPAADVPPPELKSAAEGYVAAHISQENFKEIRTGAGLRRAKRVVDKLALGAGYPVGTFPVHLVDANQEVNAAAVNGASIIVYQELLTRVPDDADLATVLGHEIGHILAKHYTDEKEEKDRAQAVQIGSSLLGAAANIATSYAGYDAAGDIAGSVTETATGMIGYGAFVGSFNRTQEYEADHLGLMIMAKAGYDPKVAPEFWRRAEQIFGSSTSQVSAFFSTHPASSDRMKALEEAMPYALQYYKPQAAAPEKTRSKR